MDSRIDATEKFHDLSYYTLSHGGPEFIHQHIVDAFTAQTADGNTKRIAVVFALIGLYLHVEKGYTGKEVQRAHTRLAKRRKTWPPVDLPDERGSITVSEVLDASPGDERDRMIHEWCVAVWEAYRASRPAIVGLLNGNSYP